MYPSRIYKILNAFEPFLYTLYLVFVCESYALLEYDSRPMTFEYSRRDRKAVRTGAPSPSR